ncbi:MAG: ABC transporter ATP-binding protein [Acidobacteriaceae bacterium]|nr:ABC transporter ATP-binding protein [Acidobacteriaceae bacterium]
MAIVETRALTKVFKAGELGAVNDVNLVTREGEFLVFLGPSGSGKTTLLRMIAGLETPTNGEIFIGGNNVTYQSPRERRIAMVFQSYALYPHLSVYNNIAFPLKAQKVPRNTHKEKVEWAAGLLGITRLLQRKPRELSGGERQRVALARAIVREPSVFLLDEPLSNLDAKLRASAREELEQFHRRVGTTTIYVTHDQVEAMAMGDRVMVLHQGVVRQIGTPKDVYDDPADTFVATFLGSPPMNLVENGDIIVGFRPEALMPVEIVPNAAIRLRLKIVNIEYLGSEWIVYGQVTDGRFNGKEVISRLGSARSFELDQTYDFGVREHELKFFDKQTEKRTQARSLAWQ